jgi:hypothetical protein
MKRNSHIEIYQTEDGNAQIEVRLEQDTLWLSQGQMAELFDKDSDAIGFHLKNIFNEGELEEKTTTEESSLVRQEGNRQVRRKIKFYSLDAIISVERIFWRFSMKKEYDLSKMKKRKNSFAKQLKKQVTLRMGVDIIDYFKGMSEETGIPYQNLINLYL